LFIDLLPSRVNDLLKLLERYHIGRLFWPILSTIGLSDFHTIVLTLAVISNDLELMLECGWPPVTIATVWRLKQ